MVAKSGGNTGYIVFSGLGCGNVVETEEKAKGVFWGVGEV